MGAPEKVVQLVERFQRNLDAYRSGKYNETQVRQEFINPFFIALGWDVNNEKGYAEAYKDVIHEDAIKVGGATKAPDYCFRIGGTRKFFLEAKKPSVSIKDEPHPAYQLRRYAWSAKLPLSILTDFEEFAVYDCRVKPVSADKASTARTLYIEYAEYADRWDEIASIFSHEEVLKGSFDRYVESTKRKKGTAEVDSAFLKEIESWREMLARTIALRNPRLSQRELNFAVQRTIDRIIFLRICEDRGVETYGRLMSLLNGDGVYERLCHLFHQADDRYNSGLFHFRKEKDRAEPPDELTLSLKIDDKLLKDMLRRLYYPESPYEFAVLPADILGQVYEQFLGKVIRLTAGHHAKVEDKPEVKKAGGVYYTPTYIVDYIVKNTVGRLLGDDSDRRGRSQTCPQKITPNDVSKLRILDPACGSGSFLIGAYQYLLDWHRDYYVNDDPEKWAKKRPPCVYQGSGGDWRLTSAERKRILLNNIYGVDIDSQAVEVTKLSLLLKVLEGESTETIGKNLELFHERALPDLGNNIKCGNSLIGPDFYDNTQMDLFDEEERYRINAFDWHAEFPEIFRGKNPGFDAIIGNPPYGASCTRDESRYLEKKFREARFFPDSYCLFMEKATNLAAREGMVSFIVPNTFCDLESCEAFRRWLMTRYTLEQIWQSGWVFAQAVVDTVVFCLRRTLPVADHAVIVRIGEKTYCRENASFVSNDLAKIDYRNTDRDKAVLSKATCNTQELGDIATVKAGVKMYEKGKGNPPQTATTMKERPFSVKGRCPGGWRALYRGSDISRYRMEHPSEFVDYGPWLAAPRAPQLFAGPKILMRRTDDRLMTTLDQGDAICVNSCHVIRLKPDIACAMSLHCLLGLLNSRLMQTVFELQNPQMVGKVFAEIKVIYVQRLPIRTLDLSEISDKRWHDRMVQLVDQMLSLHKQLAAAKTAHDKTVIQRQIDATDGQIDRLVYELYDLTDEEIKIVEEATAR
jgi:predicted type IV restriction endonuclease